MSELVNRPGVTIVIPCFNQARYLPAAVASVRSQHYQPVECIVVNDGSTDDTAAVVSQLGARVLEQSNRGLAEARNAGLAAARSELIIFLDADDELLPDAVARAAAALASDHVAAAVVGRCQVMDAAGGPLPAAHRPSIPRISMKIGCPRTSSGRRAPRCSGGERLKRLQAFHQASVQRRTTPYICAWPVPGR